VAFICCVPLADALTAEVSMNRLNDRVALMTGAARGMRAAIAQAFLPEGSPAITALGRLPPANHAAVSG
jgi:NAD(P)-dependent dehydrogenase (short-subunit alcohol dehydrogenase family)